MRPCTTRTATKGWSMPTRITLTTIVRRFGWRRDSRIRARLSWTTHCIRSLHAQRMATAPVTHGSTSRTRRRRSGLKAPIPTIPMMRRWLRSSTMPTASIQPVRTTLPGSRRRWRRSVRARTALAAAAPTVPTSFTTMRARTIGASPLMGPTRSVSLTSMTSTACR